MRLILIRIDNELKIYSLISNKMHLSFSSEIIEDEKIVKSIEQFISESKDKTRASELHKMQLKQKKNIYNKDMKEYNKILNKVVQNEKYIDKKEKVILKLKTKQQLSLSNFSIDDYKYNCSKVDMRIVEGFALFTGFNCAQLPMINNKIINQASLTKILETGEAIHRNINKIQKSNPCVSLNISIEMIRNLIKEIQQKYKHQLISPFNVLYDYMILFYHIIDKETELAYEKEELKEIVNEKDAIFIKIKMIEYEINDLEIILNDYEEYMIKMNCLIEKNKISLNYINSNEFYASVLELNKIDQSIIRKIKSLNSENTCKNTSLTHHHTKINVLKSNKPKRVPMSSLLLTSNSKQPLDSYIVDRKRSFNITNCSTINNNSKVNRIKYKINNEQSQINPKDNNSTIHKNRELSSSLVTMNIKTPSINRLSKNGNERIIAKIDVNKFTMNNNYNQVSKQIIKSKEEKSNTKKQKILFEISSSANINYSKYCQDSLYQSISNEILNFNNEINPRDDAIISPTKFKSIQAAKITSLTDVHNKPTNTIKKRNKDLNLFYVDNNITSDGCCVSCT